MAAPAVRVDLKGPVATLALDRPQVRNAMDEEMAYQLRDACGYVQAKDSVRVVVLTGSGGIFSIGAASESRSRNGVSVKASPQIFDVSDYIAAIERPVIAAINGDAMDQGLELALACDLRIIVENARLGMTQVARGTMPRDGGTQRLPRLVGRARALELLLMARAVDASEALRIGLVNEVVAKGRALERSQQLAAEIAKLAPVATQYLKEAVLKGMDATLDQGLRLEADLSILLHSTADRAEGLRSFAERRPAVFHGK
jgi:enoyl-CoA hydratase/carnithine racemase